MVKRSKNKKNKKKNNKDFVIPKGFDKTNQSKSLQANEVHAKDTQPKTSQANPAHAKATHPKAAQTGPAHAKATQPIVEDELIELEFDEESVAYYIVDENDNEIGVALYEDGVEVEYMYEYPESSDDKQEINSITDDKNNFQISKRAKEDLIQIKEDLVNITKEGVAIQQELKMASDELKSAYDDILKSVKPFGKRFR